jgi:hypothetical protein
MKRLSYLADLNLDRNNTITDEGLKRLSCLTNLSLSNNNTITDEGIKRLSCLTSLPHSVPKGKGDLSYNDTITNAGIKGLFSLRELNLFNNNTITNDLNKIELLHIWRNQRHSV